MAVDLYRYYPTFVKLRDRLASGIDDADSRETVLAKLVYMLDQVFDDTDAFIQTLLNLNDPDHVDQQYFSHISYLLGTMLPNGANEDETRFIIKQLVSHYKTSGTHPSWHTAWYWSDQPQTKVVELFKSEQQEVGNYATSRSVNHPLKSARIQLGVCASSCESVCVTTCESSCESIVEIGQELPVPEALSRLAYVEYLRPIHVLLRQEAEDTRLQSGFPTTQETLGHYPTVYNVEPNPWLGSEVYGTFSNQFYSSGDELDVDVQCVALCEVSCQSCCEAVCECDPCEVVCQVGGCELFCTTNCQGWCEFPCEGACQFACTACQAGACTAACAGACTSSCEGACESACQDFECQVGTCQGSCETECQSHFCEAASCTANMCENSCVTGNCTTCQAGDCTATCAGACQTTGPCQTWACQASKCEISSCQVDKCTTSSCQVDKCTASMCQTDKCTVSSCQTDQCTASMCQTDKCTTSSCQEGQCTLGSCVQGECEASQCQINVCQGNGCETSCQASCTLSTCQFNACQQFAGTCQASYCMTHIQP